MVLVANTVEVEKALVKKLLTNYDVSVIPRTNLSQPLVLTYEISLLNIINVVSSYKKLFPYTNHSQKVCSLHYKHVTSDKVSIRYDITY